MNESFVSWSQWEEGSASFIHSFIHEGSSSFLGVFPCSQCVPIMFPWDSQVVSPKMFPIAPHIYHIELWFCPKLNSHVCKLKRWAIGAAHLFLFCNWRSKEITLIWECSMLPKIWWWANQYDSFNPKKKSCEYTHELINMNCKMPLKYHKGPMYVCMVKENSKFNLEKRLNTKPLTNHLIIHMAYNIDNMMTLEIPLEIHQLGMATIIHCTQFGFVTHWMIPHQTE